MIAPGDLLELVADQAGHPLPAVMPVAPGVLPRSQNGSRRVVDVRERAWS